MERLAEPGLQSAPARLAAQPGTGTQFQDYVRGLAAPAGTSLPARRGTLSDLHNIFTRKTIGAFTEAEARRFLAARLQNTGVAFTEHDVACLITESNCHPRSCSKQRRRCLMSMRELETCQVAREIPERPVRYLSHLTGLATTSIINQHSTFITSYAYLPNLLRPAAAQSLNPPNPAHYWLVFNWIFFQPNRLKHYLYQIDPELYRALVVRP